jgi:hypothetical protein
VAPPTLDDDLSLSQSVEYLAVEQFVAQTRIEAFDVTVLRKRSFDRTALTT